MDDVHVREGDHVKDRAEALTGTSRAKVTEGTEYGKLGKVGAPAGRCRVCSRGRALQRTGTCAGRASWRFRGGGHSSTPPRDVCASWDRAGSATKGSTSSAMQTAMVALVQRFKLFKVLYRGLPCV